MRNIDNSHIARNQRDESFVPPKILGKVKPNKLDPSTLKQVVAGNQTTIAALKAERAVAQLKHKQKQKHALLPSMLRKPSSTHTFGEVPGAGGGASSWKSHGMQNMIYAAAAAAAAPNLLAAARPKVCGRCFQSMGTKADWNKVGLTCARCHETFHPKCAGIAVNEIPYIDTYICVLCTTTTIGTRYRTTPKSMAMAPPRTDVSAAQAHLEAAKATQWKRWHGSRTNNPSDASHSQLPKLESWKIDTSTPYVAVFLFWFVLVRFGLKNCPDRYLSDSMLCSRVEYDGVLLSRSPSNLQMMLTSA